MNDSDLEQMFLRWLQDCMTEAEPLYWLRRAKELDKIGTPWGDQAAAACRNKARLQQAERTGETVTEIAPIICKVCDTPLSPWSCSCGQTRAGVSSGDSYR